MSCARLYTIANPYTSDEVLGMRFEQSGDVLYLAVRGLPPAKLARYGNSSWLYSLVNFGTTTVAPTGLAATPMGSTGDSGYKATVYSYVITTIDATTNQESLQSAAISCNNDLTLDGHSNNITWSAVANAVYYRVYKQEGSLYGYIGTSVTTSLNDNNIASALDDTPPEGAIPFTNLSTNPTCVTFHEQRSIYANTENRPNSLYMSQSANIENFDASLPVKDDDAITLAVAAQKLNSVQHLVSMKALIVLTSDAVFSVQGGQDGYLTPTQPPNIQTESYRGSSSVRPAVIDDVIMFATSLGGSIRTLGYTFESDGYQGNDLTVYAPHLFQGYVITAMAWCEYPLQTLWCVRSDGRLVALTWLKEQQVWGWSLCETNGVVESVCSIDEGGLSRLYIIVGRTVGGQYLRYVERLANPLWPDQTQACYLDSAFLYSGAPQQQFYNLDHLEGVTISALCDGALVEGLTVTNGIVDLGHAYSNVVLGLPFTAWIETLPLVIPSQGAQSKKTVMGQSQILVQSTIGLRTMGNSLQTVLNEAPGDDDMFAIKQRTTETYNEATQVFTGYLEADVDAEWNQGKTLVIKSDVGMPMTVLGVFPDTDVGG